MFALKSGGSGPAGGARKPSARMLASSLVGPGHVLIELSPREHERVRTRPRRVPSRPAHELPGAELVVSTHPGYVVVEKEGEAGEVAEAEDPRD
jgi:hypothetical protein